MAHDKDTTLTHAEVLEIRTLILSGHKTSDVSRMTGVSLTHVSRIANGHAWPSGPFPKIRECFTPSNDVLRDIKVVKQHYRRMWRDESNAYWAGWLIEEVIEAGETVVGTHKGPLYWELVQIASICANWMELLHDRGEVIPT